MVDKTTDNKIEIIKLYISDYLADYHIREMGKIIKKSHVTLLPHIKSLEKEGIILPKIIGKNKSYFLNFNNIIVKDYILLSEIRSSIEILERYFILKKIYAGIMEINPSGTIVLFGSYAKETHKEDSDIDLLSIGKLSDKEEEHIKNIGETYGKIINIKKTSLNAFTSGLRKKDPLLIEIIKKHILLHNPEGFINALWKYYYEIKR